MPLKTVIRMPCQGLPTTRNMAENGGCGEKDHDDEGNLNGGRRRKRKNCRLTTEMEDSWCTGARRSGKEAGPSR
ncbi:hypothetical protein L2E82_01944 [Cichorium intybus]|uniref:Uncharacterized protein n=1 Tax=Cichorium intybus TaxID=13427 RepID=A0ACB9H1U8_CICIN|nr:hypothetical protein L2E82_01944 [Cichorium intybus]